MRVAAPNSQTLTPHPASPAAATASRHRIPVRPRFFAHPDHQRNRLARRPADRPDRQQPRHPSPRLSPPVQIQRPGRQPTLRARRPTRQPTPLKLRHQRRPLFRRPPSPPTLPFRQAPTSSERGPRGQMVWLDAYCPDGSRRTLPDQRTERLTKGLSGPPGPLFKGGREMALRKCDKPEGPNHFQPIEPLGELD